MKDIRNTELETKLNDYLDKSLKLLKVNPSSSLTETRKALEYLCKKIHLLEELEFKKDQNGYVTLKNMIINLIHNHKIRSTIYYKMHSIRSDANDATHDNDFDIKERTALFSIHNFIEILLWFCSEYKLSKKFKDKIVKISEETAKPKERIYNKSLERKMSNPHYFSDLKYLEKNNYFYPHLIKNNGILIVTGTSINAELLDRPVAEILRDEIERQYANRAIILSDRYYYADPALKSYPVISIGDRANNMLTAEIIEKGERWSYMDTYGAYYNQGIQMVALWGNSATKTKLTVDSYIVKEEGLPSFIKALS